MAGLFSGLVSNLVGANVTPASSGQLASNGRPQMYRDNSVKNIMQRTSVLADKVDRNQVLDTERALGNQEKQMIHLSQQANNLLRLRDMKLEELKIRTDYSRQAMKQETQFQRIKAQHSKAAYRHELSSESTHVNLNAFEQATNNAAAVISF